MPYQYLPDVAGGLAMMYNLTGNDGQRINSLDLTAQTIADIFLGRIQYWDSAEILAANTQLAGLLPHTPVVPVYRSDGAGENYLLSDYLLHQANSTFVAAQTAFGLSATGPSAIGQPSATWPQPACLVNGGCGNRLAGYPGWTTGTGLEGAAGADISANDVASAQSTGAITYVETAYAKEHAMPVANLVNQSGTAVPPSSVNVATALEDAILHADLTQDLTNVYTNPLPNAYPLSAYSYLVTQCSPALAGAQNVSCAADPNGAASNLADRQGTGTRPIRRLHGVCRTTEHGLPRLLAAAPQPRAGRLQRHRPAQRRSATPAAHGRQLQEPVRRRDHTAPRQPVVIGVAGGSPPVRPGTSPAGSAGRQGAGSGGAASKTAPVSRHRRSSGRARAPRRRAVGAEHGCGSGKACASGTSLAAQACTANGTLKAGFAVVNGQVVRTLGAAGTVGRAAALLDATHLISGPGAAAVLGWIALGARGPAASPAGRHLPETLPCQRRDGLTCRPRTSTSAPPERRSAAAT